MDRSTPSTHYPVRKVFSQTQEPIPEKFLITTEQKSHASKTLNRDHLNSSYFIIPMNDGEALRAVQILEAINAPHIQVSPQPWGATLKAEKIPEIFPEAVKNICIFEMPGTQIEEELKAKGFNIIIFDHHLYDDLDRTHEQSSLEQLCAWIGWPLSELDHAIAINDRSYIPGLARELGMNRLEIEEIRFFDFQAQGNKKAQLEKSIAKSRKIIPNISKLGPIYIFEKLGESHSIVKQEVSLLNPQEITSVIEIAKTKIGFSGHPEIAKKLLDFDFEKYGIKTGQYKKYLGGDLKYSRFFNFKLLPNTGASLNQELIQAIKDFCYKIIST